MLLNKLKKISTLLVHLRFYTDDVIDNLICRAILKMKFSAAFDYYKYRTINSLFPVKNSVVAIYFLNGENKKSALFIEYDNKYNSYIVHYAKRLYKSDKKNMPRCFSFKYEADFSYIEDNIKSILNDISVGVQNIYRVMRLNAIPRYFPAVSTHKININEISENDIENYFDLIESRLNENSRAKHMLYNTSCTSRRVPRRAF